MNSKKRCAVLCLSIVFVLSGCASSFQSKASSASYSSNNQTQPTHTPQKSTENDLTKIIQLVIDLPALERYYHVDTVADRKPLFILKNEVLAETISLSKFGETVNFASCDEIKEVNKPYLEFATLEVKEDTATVVFRYRVEGIEGRLLLSKQSGEWMVQKQELVEAKFADKGCTSDKKTKN